ncbi:MAG: hypothetical protein AAAFM81_15155 [Pseudomonadota bacterium]
MRIITTLAATLTLSGCAGQLYTHTNPNTACKDGDCKGTYPGVLFHPLTVKKSVYLQDRILNSKGELTHWITGPDGKKCLPTVVEESKLVADTTQQWLVRYDAAFFESSTFNVELKPDGTLSKVGASSTPGGKALVDSLVSLATTVKTLNHGQVEAFVEQDPATADPLCSHGKLSLP